MGLRVKNEFAMPADRINVRINLSLARQVNPSPLFGERTNQLIVADPSEVGG